MVNPNPNTMKRFLIIKNFLHGTYTTPLVDRKDLVGVKSGETDHIIDLKNGTEYNPRTNAWEPIKEYTP